jgi:hypothetical protein
MADIDVEISTDRGAIDTLNNVDADGSVITAGDGGGVSGKTDTNGYAFFQISSRVPGKTLISTKVDSMVDLNQLSLTFTPLPFPKYVTVSVQVPKIISPTGSGEVTIFKPSQTEETSSQDLVTLGVKIVIPFWVVALLFGIFLLTVILFIVIVILFSRIKHLQKKEIAEIEETQELVKKEEEEIEKIESNGKPPIFPPAN